MAYDEAARIMCGPRARTNFPNGPQSSKLLSATLMAKLHKCHMTSLKMAKKVPVFEPGQVSSFDRQNGGGGGANYSYGSSSEISGQEFKCLEDDHIEQMIQELLDYSSVELCSVMEN